MRKIISMLLIATMLFGTIGAVFAEEPVYQISLLPVQDAYEAGSTITIAGSILKDGVGEADVDVLIDIEDKDHGGKLWTRQVITGENGEFTAEYSISEDAQDKAIVISIQSCNMAETVEVSITALKSEPEADYEIIMDDIKPVYEANTTITIKGSILKDSVGEADVDVLIDIEDKNDGTKQWTEQVTTGEDGSFSAEYEISADLPDKELLIRIQSCGETKTVETSIKTEIVEPEYEIILDDIQSEYNAGDVIVISGKIEKDGIGEADAAVLISIEDENSQIWDENTTTGADGSFSAEYQIADDAVDKDIVIKVQACEKTKTVESSIKAAVVEPEYAIILDDIQSEYKPGDVIAISGKVEKAGKGEADVDVLIDIEDKSDRIKLWTNQVTTEKDGSFTAEYQISENEGDKDIVIKVQACGKEETLESSIRAVVYVYEMTLNKIKSSYNAGDTIIIAGSLKKDGLAAGGEDVLVTIEKTSGSELWRNQAVTKADGTFSVKYVISEDAIDRDIVIKVQACGITKSVNSSIKAVEEEHEYEITLNQINSSYKPGSTITISGNVLKDGVGESDLIVLVTIENEKDGSQLLARQLTTKTNGGFSTTYLISVNSPDMDLVIRVQSCGVTESVETAVASDGTTQGYQLTLNEVASTYSPGSTIGISGKLLKDGKAAANEDVYIVISNKASGSRIWSATVKTKTDGSFSNSYVIAANTKSMNIEIKAEACGKTKAVDSAISPILTSVTTNKTSYYRGDTVSIFGSAVFANGETVDNESVDLTIYFGANVVKSFDLDTNSQGGFSATYVLPDSASYGNYTVKAEIKDKLAESSFMVVQRTTGGGDTGSSQPSTTSPAETQIINNLKALGNKTGDEALNQIASMMDNNSSLSAGTSMAILEAICNAIYNQNGSFEKSKETILKAIDKTIGNAILQSKDEAEKAELKEKLAKAINGLVQNAAKLQGTALKLQENSSSITVTPDNEGLLKALGSAEAIIKELTDKLKLKSLENIMGDVAKEVHLIVSTDAIAKSEVIVELDSITIAKLKDAGVTLVIETKGLAFRLQSLESNGTKQRFISKTVDSTILVQLKSSADSIVPGKLKITASVLNLSFEGTPMIEIPVTASMLQGLDVDKLGIYTYNESTKKWEYLNTRYDAQRKVLIAKAAHSGIYAVMEYSRVFGDLTSHWAKADIEKMAAKYITDGVGNNNFGPNSIITRAEFATWIVRALGLSGSGNTHFADVDSKAWYAAAVALAADKGIISAEAGNKFRPTDKLTREEMAVMSANAYKLLYNKTLIGRDLEYKDKNEISAAALEAVKGLTYKGIMQGSNGNFMPRSNTTRAEAIVVLKRILNN